MSRTLAGISLILMLLTGLVVGQLGIVGTSRRAPVSISSAASLQGSYEFYDAINDFMATGNPAQLRSTLHPEFVDHSLDAGSPATGADLERYIDSVRLASPGLEFSITAVLREPGVVAVTIVSELPVHEEDVRLRLDVHDSLPAFDLLRFRGSRLIERWSFPTAPRIGHVETLAEVTFELSVRTTGYILERYTLDQSEHLDLLHETGVVILTESGAVSCESIATSRLGQLQDTQEPCRKHQGSNVIIEGGRSIRLTNPGAELASFVTWRLQEDGIAPGASDTGGSVGGQSEVSGQVLAFGSFELKGREPLEIVIQQAYLEPGNGIAEHVVIGEEIVLPVAGEISVSSLYGDLESLTSTGQLTPVGPPPVVTAHTAIVAHHDASVGYRNVTNAGTTVLVFSIAPAKTSIADEVAPSERQLN